MKKSIVILSLISSIFLFSGCSSYSDGYEDGYYDGAREHSDKMISLFLIDKGGFSVDHVKYSCVDENNHYTGTYLTTPSGEFSFYVGERCTFELVGLDGTPDDPLFIEDDRGRGKGDIPYECSEGDAGFTTDNGSFDYIADDNCTFYF
jgi:hypothetical protein